MNRKWTEKVQKVSLRRRIGRDSRPKNSQLMNEWLLKCSHHNRYRSYCMCRPAAARRADGDDDDDNERCCNMGDSAEGPRRRFAEWDNSRAGPRTSPPRLLRPTRRRALQVLAKLETVVTVESSRKEKSSPADRFPSNKNEQPLIVSITGRMWMCACIPDLHYKK